MFEEGVDIGVESDVVKREVVDVVGVLRRLELVFEGDVGISGV